MVPLELLPSGFKTFSLLLPATHAMNAFNFYAMGVETPFPAAISVAVLAAGSIVSCVLSVLLFSWDSKEERATRSAYWAILALVPYVLSLVFK